ncbi:astacin-like metalloprotease toxin 1 [Trichonephila inaurata madagascariensis]|uniref:Metalloendopeptidase n=1 Tax=Trichonephila inaurata madagascariensis TaxID=2747483 RepID=A0A8X7CHX1_9ARAC|nr:astacin-like metalloprotease toxin 1 [Trichonephila inaurata madagascariensis]
MKFFVLTLYFFAAAFADADYDIKRLALQNPDLYDGDMLGIDGPFDAERNAIPGQKFRWPNAVIPYVIDSTLEGYKHVILDAIKNYHHHTCVHFLPRTDQSDYVKIFFGQGCYSQVGRVGGQQLLSLGNGCLYVGTAIHEFGHALGFYHEQSRSDRDDYLIIYLENVLSGTEYNFDKLAPTQNILYTPFDYDSIMIYGNDAFSKNKQDTMVAKNGRKLLNPFDKNSMTKSDIDRVNKMYHCIE